MNEPRKSPPASQTLSRGIRVLEVLSEARSAQTIDELAERLELHRSITYRLVRTLQDHGLVTRDGAGRTQLGPRLAALAANVAHDLQSAARPELTAAARDLGMTCFLAMLDAEDCVTLVSAAPGEAVASVAQRPGSRHRVVLGAPGKAILSVLPVGEWPAGVSDRLRVQISQIRDQGFATSHDEVIPTVQAVAVPLQVRGQLPAAVAAIHVSSQLDASYIAARLQRVAGVVLRELGG